jgi:hypothetical protein
MEILDTERLANPVPFAGADFEADAVETEDVPPEEVVAL